MNMSVKLLIILTVTVICLINSVYSKCKTEDKEICQRVRCAFPASCPPGQIVYPADTKNCICCPYCDYGCGPNQTPESCHAADCKPVQPCPEGQHLVKSNYCRCICCDMCVVDNYGN